MLPYWYRRMYEGDPAGTFKRGRAGDNLVFKHHDVFILGSMELDSYEPVLNVSVMPWSTKNLVSRTSLLSSPLNLSICICHRPPAFGTSSTFRRCERGRLNPTLAPMAIIQLVKQLLKLSSSHS